MWVLIQTHPKSRRLGHPHRAAVVLGPHAGGQAVLHAVGPAQRLVLVGELLHGDDRAEDLVLDLLVVLLQAGDDRRRVEVALVALTGAAGVEAGVVGQPVDHAGDPVELVRVVERAVEHVLVVGQPGLGALGLLGQRRDEVVVHAGPGEHAGRGGAVLAGVEVAGPGDALGRGLDVGVVEDDHRRLAAELEVDPLELRPPPSRRPPCRRGRSR